MSATGKAFVNLSTSPALPYAFLGVVVIVGFVVIHSALKQDVTDVGNVIKKPFGQGFDDTVQGFFDKIFGGSPDTTENATAPPTTYPVQSSDFGLTNPTGWSG